MAEKMKKEQRDFIINVCQDIRTEGMRGTEELEEAYNILFPGVKADIQTMMDAITNFTIENYNNINE